MLITLNVDFVDNVLSSLSQTWMTVAAFLQTDRACHIFSECLVQLTDSRLNMQIKLCLIV